MSRATSKSRNGTKTARKPSRTARPTLAKAEVLELVRALPDAVDVEELIYRLYLREKLAQAEADIAAGRTFSAEEVRKQAASWRR